MTILEQLRQPALESFCQRWKIRELAVFGSVARGQETQASDVDLLVSFDPESSWTLLDHIRMEDELAALLGRPVDLVSRRAIERSRNPNRREAILRSAETIYVA